jgi:methionyl-tRNA synthetase
VPTYIVTSALPYVSAIPHLGNLAGSVLPADVFARFLRLSGEDVIYVCGTDEHGTPITVAADKEGITPRELADKYHKLISDSFAAFEIKFDNFSRTTHPNHYVLTQHFFSRLLENGYISKKTVQMPFCLHCKKFLPDRYVEGECPKCHFIPARGDQCDKCGSVLDPVDLIKPYCITCKSTPQILDTEHYFLELPKFSDRLQKWISGKDWPPNAKNVSLGWIREGLKDRAITRDLSWGVPIPLEGTEGKVIYVWFDAPIGYISATEELGRAGLWKAEETKLVHFLGKDNVPFHSIIWPSILMGAEEGYILPDYICAFEYLNWAGQKFSKSRGVGIWIDEALKLFPTDYWRYALIALLPQQRDSDFSWQEFEKRVNDELNDIFGNFVHRTLSFVALKFGSIVPDPGKLTHAEEAVLSEAETAFKEVASLLYAHDIKGALARAILLAKRGNQFFNESAPWKDPEGNPRAIYAAVQLVSALSTLVSPFIPGTCAKIRRTLGLSPEPFGWEIEKVPGGTRLLGEIKPLFSKVSARDAQVSLNDLRGLNEKEEKGSKMAQEENKDGEKVSIDYFRKVQLRVATILSAEPVLGAKKLLKLSIDVGEGKPRTLVAGIAEKYPPLEIVGRQIVVVANLEHATIRGVTSEGMLLAGVDEASGEISLLSPEKPLPPGTRVS